MRIHRGSSLARCMLGLIVVVMVCGLGCRGGVPSVPGTSSSGFRDREANWGMGYRATNETDKGSGLNPKGREIERSLGYQ